MTGNDLLLRFSHPQSSNWDRRTVLINQVSEEADGSEEVEMYKFQHPYTGSVAGVTTIQRNNLTVKRWEPAGQIEWMSDSNAYVYFGIERVSIRELRRAKKAASKSRRFKAGGSEYKWKIMDNGEDLICVSGTRGKIIAMWSQQNQTLRVAERGEASLDRIVVTCFLNTWMKQLNLW